MNSPVEEIIENLNIDRQRKVIIFVQIIEEIIKMIQQGILKDGQQLPGTREFATILNVNRNTIVRSMNELEALGYVKIVPNVGTFIVSPHQDKITAFTISNFQEKAKFKFKNSVLLDLPASPKDFSICIDDGNIDAREIELKIPSKTYSNLLLKKSSGEKIKSNDAQFFIKQFTNFINHTRNININPSNLLLTRTPEMALQIISKVLLDKESWIAVEEISDYKANMIFQENNGKIIPIKSDEDGILPSELKEICQNHSIKALYLNPNHSYPTSHSISNRRKNELIELSNDFGFVIIENDADFDFYYNKRSNYPLSTNNSLENVVYTSQFGKEYSPSFRLSYIIGPTDFIQEAKKHLNIYESPIDPLVLQTIGEMIFEGDVHRILKKQRKFYKERRDLSYQLLIEHFGEMIQINSPENGFAFWIEWKISINLLQLKNDLEQDDIYLPQQNLYQNESICAMRFGFASLKEEELLRIINTIKKSIEKQKLNN